MRKLKSLLVAIMAFAMVMAMSSVALAADNQVNTQGQTGTVKVYFTTGCTYSDDDTNGDINYYWVGDVDNLTLLNDNVGAQTVNIADLNGMTKGYEDGNTNPFGTKVSVFDAIYYQGVKYNGHNKVVDMITGWGPAYGAKKAGAYVENVDNQDLESKYGYNADGTMWMNGYGFYVAVLRAGETEPTFSDIYLSNVALEDGMTIFVDYSYYDYQHQK